MHDKMPGEIWVYIDRVGRKVISGKNDPIHVGSIKFVRADLVGQPASVGDVYDLFERIETGLDELKSANNRGCLNDYWENIQAIKLNVETLRSYDWDSLQDTEKAPPPLVTADAVRAALDDLSAQTDDFEYMVPTCAAAWLEKHLQTVRTLLQQAAHDKGDGGGGKPLPQTAKHEAAAWKALDEGEE
jgi:hypothetical protein